MKKRRYKYYRTEKDVPKSMAYLVKKGAIRFGENFVAETWIKKENGLFETIKGYFLQPPNYHELNLLIHDQFHNRQYDFITDPKYSIKDDEYWVNVVMQTGIDNSTYNILMKIFVKNQTGIKITDVDLLR